jgi:hypothetical protein
MRIREVVHRIPGVAQRAHDPTEDTRPGHRADETRQLDAELGDGLGCRRGDVDDRVGAHQLVVRDVGRGRAHATQERDRFGRVLATGLEFVPHAEAVGERWHSGAGDRPSRTRRHAQAYVRTMADGFVGSDVIGSHGGPPAAG